MRIVSGVDAFRAFSSSAEIDGAWPAWRHHCLDRFRDVHNIILRVLYQSDQVDVIRLHVEAMDIERATERVWRFVEDRAEAHIGRLLRQSEGTCPAPQNYSVYLIPGCGGRSMRPPFRGSIRSSTSAWSCTVPSSTSTAWFPTSTTTW